MGVMLDVLTGNLEYHLRKGHFFFFKIRRTRITILHMRGILDFSCTDDDFFLLGDIELPRMRIISRYDHKPTRLIYE